MARYRSSKELREIATFFRSNPEVEGLYIWSNGSIHPEACPWEQIAYYISRICPLNYSKAGDWSSELNFVDKLEEEEFTWELARRGMPEEILFPVVVDRL